MNPMHEPLPADAKERERALDPRYSFIVQAPAGSGKTELLIQRYLCLLARVNAPEEVIAITFTRKAAAGMRSRILEALEQAENEDCPDTPHKQRTWNLARAVSRRDKHQCWQLSDNPGRLRIQTIDALCAAITRHMPYLSRLGAAPEICGEPQRLYLQAARETVAELEAGTNWSPSIEALVRHLDNQLERLEQLIAAMLAKRDQWLRHIAQREDPAMRRKKLEDALKAVIAEALAACRSQFPEACMGPLLDLARFAAGNLEEAADSESPVKACKDLHALPQAAPEFLSQWLGLCELLLTRDGQWRRQSDKRLGFPAPGSVKKDRELKNYYTQKKAEFKELLDNLRSEVSLGEHLHRIRSLPDAQYQEEQWQILQALSDILRLSVAHLNLVFQSTAQVDFAEVAMRAAFALGTPENPTDLGLAMDYRLGHILIDEFQDTSITQFDFLRRLTMGWQPGDGRTFFAVGDPMQSIYGFREAEVGLFIKTWDEGLGQIELHPLKLSVNFRSQQKIVEWVNESFPLILPGENDAAAGAVAYSPATAALPPEEEAAVQIHPHIPPDREKEAETVLACIREARQRDPGGRIAVLVRSRPHLETILRHLKSRDISFTGVEIESLKNRPVIQDLLSLTRALTHPADRIAWLGVLRAPWCGLRLNDLHALAGDAPHLSVVDLLKDEDRLASLSKDGRGRAVRVRDILLPVLLNRECRSLRRLVEGAWLLLGGPACCLSSADLEDARAYLELMDETLGAGGFNDLADLESSVAELFARPDPTADETLQVMTIHKAKGLEFDTVILPGLEKSPPPDAPRLLMWLERPAGGQNDLLLAPISAYGSRTSHTYEYIRRFERQKRRYEDTRLLYVAATRAKKCLHLIGGARPGSQAGSLRTPDANSLLHPLWPVVSDVFTRAVESPEPQPLPDDAQSDDSNGRPGSAPAPIRRLSAQWRPCMPPPGLEGKIKVERALPVTEPQTPPFDWAGETARRVGTVVHRWLGVICEQGVEQWSKPRIHAFSKSFDRELESAGVSGDMREEALSRVESALAATLEDEMGRWILSRHRSDACEYGITGRIDGSVVNVVIDRTFIDDEGVRWIIDYKSSVHSGGSLEAFLDQETGRYQAQMQTYARIMGALENRPIRLMLYYPQLKNYRQWMAR